MFSMVTVTFMLVAGQYKRMSRIAGQVETVGNDPRKQLDEAFGQLARGTANPHSSLFGHDLLGDLYGHDGVKIVNGAPIQADNPTINLPPPNNTVKQLIDLQFDAIADTVVQRMPGLPAFGATLGGEFEQLKAPGHFNGCVLTFLDGDLKNRSTRIVGWGFNTTTQKFVARVVSVDGMTANTPGSAASTSTRLLINGRPFNGTGFGLNPAAGLGEPTLLSMQNADAKFNTFEALMPNPRHFIPNGADYSVFGGRGGADEDYDAPDPQNMALAYIPLVSINKATIDREQILPSFHRPDLIRYHQANAPGWNNNKDLRRRVFMRPGQFDHPGFTGSNPVVPFNATDGPWDVDNDGDGVAESVWVDIGLPVQTGPDGRRYKPLVAFLCVDLDGRLNVNAHGTWAHAQGDYDRLPQPIGQPLAATTDNINNYLYNSTGSAVPELSLPRGMGVGPAEIDLSWLWGDDHATRTQEFRQFLIGRVAPNKVAYEGRYGEWGFSTPWPGRPNHPPMYGPDDLLALIRRYDMPPNSPPDPWFNYYDTTTSSNYGSPSDLWGRAMVAVDYAGQPVWSFHREVGGAADELGAADPDMPYDPYTLNLSRRRVRASSASAGALDDNVFTPAELERVLRRYDLDASVLPDRLRYLLDPNDARALDYAHLITTDSFDLPTPAVAATRDMIAQGIQTELNLAAPTGLTLVDLLKMKLLPSGMSFDAVPPGLIAQLLPPEVIAGQKFDLNRPFGNGRDDNNNGVVDEPGENEASFWNNEAKLAASPGGFATTAPDYSNRVDDIDKNGTPGEVADSQMARQLYARYLYVMMLLLTDINYNPYPADVTPDQVRELNIRRIAQWAINVVDYRDPDSIMTPFEYDVDPFNADGWQVDGILGSGDDSLSDRRVVWGCEQPELLLTETLALHDRRVKDLPSPGNTRNDATTPDPDMDQEHVPEGSAFFELYCPRNGNNSTGYKYPAELYTTGANPRLDLGRLAPVGAGGEQHPVWQIAITETSTVTANDILNRVTNRPDTTNFDPAPGSSSSPLLNGVFSTTAIDGTATVDRFVWFSTLDPNINNTAIFYNSGGNPTVLSPGQFAFVGPRLTTHVGLTNGGTLSPQSIVLDPTNGTVTFNPANAMGQDAATKAINNVVPIVCDSGSSPTQVAGWSNVGLSISEPLFWGPNYYPAPTILDPISALNNKYATTLDNPLDSAATSELGSIPNATTTGLHPNFKTALLQRLANPLVAYHPVTNPYITVDWQPIDLNVFNGDELPPSPNDDPADPGWAAGSTLPATLPQPGVGSRERGTTVPAPPVYSNLWGNFPQQPTNITIPVGGAGNVFDYNLHQTLGYLNRSMGSAPWFANTPPAVPNMSPVNYAYGNGPNPTTKDKPYSWLTWNDRPYFNAMELVLVPPTSAEQLIRDFSSAPSAVFNPYSSAKSSFTLPFKHLSNFFQSGDGTFNPATPASPYLYRILDYVGVPSPFVGTDTVFSPNKFGGTSLSSQQITSPFGLSEQDLACYLHPPFSRVSNYRDPGKVNINTIAGVGGTVVEGLNTTWTAIVNGSRNFITGDPQPRWPDIVQSRRGGQGGNVSEPSTLSSVFANPFRSAAGAAYRLPGTTAGVTPEPEVNVTMLRPHPTDTNRPLFSPLPDPTRPYVDPDQHAYFRYQDLTRLSNSLTTRSNVYAVWITMGYFEVMPAPPGASGIDYAIYPDGWQLGAELGSDTGDIQRHRAFYIFDRSIPVGYEPGKDLNIDDATLVKRYIE